MFGRLDTLTLDEFIASERADDHLCIFLHIPKTAGSSFSNELARARRPYRNIHVDYRDTNVPVIQQMNQAVQRFISEMRERRFLSCSGHLQIKHADAIAASFPQSRAISFLRHPVDRFVSDFRYARTPAHPPYRDFIARFPTFESYVHGPGHNKMFQRLTGNARMNVDDGIAFIDQRYLFIGVVELYAMSFNVIFRLFGKDLMPTLHARTTEATSDNFVEVTPELAALIAEKNAKDLALYEHVHRRLTAKIPEWLAMASHAEAEAPAYAWPAAGGLRG